MPVLPVRVYRRNFLGALGCCGVAAPVWFLARPPTRSVRVRYWLSEQAAEYEVHTPISTYVTAGLDTAFDEVEVTYGGAIPLETEHGYEVTRSGEWPRRMLSGYIQESDDASVAHVHLLVTNGTMSDGPTGLGFHHVASVGGAQYLPDVPPREEVSGPVPYTRDLWAMHVLLHEVGHAFGLTHEHGDITILDDGAVVTPMVSTYAWMGQTAHFNAEETACGREYPPTPTGARYLSFDYSACSQRTLRQYGGGIHPW